MEGGKSLRYRELWGRLPGVASEQDRALGLGDELNNSCQEAAILLRGVRLEPGEIASADSWAQGFDRASCSAAVAASPPSQSSCRDQRSPPFPPPLYPASNHLKEKVDLLQEEQRLGWLLWLDALLLLLLLLEL